MKSRLNKSVVSVVGQVARRKTSQSVSSRSALSPEGNESLTGIVIAISADPNNPASVPRIGGRVASEVGELVDATFIFHARHRADLAGCFPADSVEYAGSKLLANGLRRLSGRLFPNRWGPISIIEIFDYIVFDVHAYWKARSLVRRRHTDFILRVNPVSYRFASLLPRIRVPVFTGPHNGGMEWPPPFAYLERTEKTGAGLRFFGNIMHFLYRDTSRYTGIFVANELCARTVGAAYREKVIFCPENGVDGVAGPSPWAGDARRLLFVGRLVPVKALDTAIKALSRLPSEVNLTVVGDGPQRRELEDLAETLGVSDRCLFVGQKTHEEVDEYYRNAGAFVFPSVREAGGMAVLEAMSHALPCLVADWGGPALYTRDTGIRLSVESRQALENDLVDSLLRLLNDPDEGRRVGAASQQAVLDHFIWSSKAEFLIDSMRERLWTVPSD